jgi:hypothetical protein
MTVNNEVGRKKSVSILWLYTSVCVDGQEHFSQSNRSLGQDSNSGLPEYEAEVLKTFSKRTVGQKSDEPEST